MQADEPKWPGRELRQHSGPPPAGDVLVVDCLVYVLRQADGNVRARLTNLVGFEVTASNERAALAKLIGELKQQLPKYLESDEPIPYVKEPAPPEPGEQIRRVPMHL